MRLETSTQRLAELIDNFTQLRSLPAFQALERELDHVVAAHGWRDPPVAE